MWRDNNAVRVEERVALLRRFFPEDVERRTRYLSFFDGTRCCFLIDDASAGGVYEADVVVHGGELLVRDHAARVVGKRRVYAHELRGFEDLVELSEFGTEFVGAVLTDEGVVRDDVHTQSVGAFRHLAAYSSQPEDAQRLALGFDTHEVALSPLSFLQRGVRLRYVSRERKEERDSVFRRRNRVALGRVRDDDTVACRRLYVDVVDTDACASYYLQRVRRLYDAFVHLGSAADDDGVVTSYALYEFVLR